MGEPIDLNGAHASRDPFYISSCREDDFEDQLAQ